MNNNSHNKNHSPEHKGRLHKAPAELAALSTRQTLRYNAYADMYKAIELSNQGNVNSASQAQLEVIQNVAGVAIANESFQKATSYPENQSMTTEQSAPVAQVAAAEAIAADPVVANPVATNPLLAEAYENLNNAYGRQEIGHDDVAQAA